MGPTLMHTLVHVVRDSTTADGLAGLKPSFCDVAISRTLSRDGVGYHPRPLFPVDQRRFRCLGDERRHGWQIGARPLCAPLHLRRHRKRPLLMLTCVIPATTRALVESELTIENIDTFELNQALTPVPLGAVPRSSTLTRRGSIPRWRDRTSVACRKCLCGVSSRQ